MKNLVKPASLSLLAAALAFLPVQSRAQDAAPTAPAVTAPATSPGTNAAPVHKKRAGGLPFHGKIAALDASAGTFTVGTLNFTISSTTKISTNGVPATLDSFKVGDNVTGYYKKSADGKKLTVSTLRLAVKKKKAAAAPATN